MKTLEAIAIGGAGQPVIVEIFGLCGAWPQKGSASHSSESLQIVSALDL